MTLRKKALENTVGAGENAGYQPFPSFSILSRRETIILTTLLSINVFNLDQAKILLFGKELSKISFAFPIISQKLSSSENGPLNSTCLKMFFKSLLPS